MATSSPPSLPGGLGLVRDLVNTIDLESGEDSLASVRELRSWLAERGFQRSGEAREPDRRRAIALRESLRKLLLANGGEPLDPAAPGELVAAAGRSALRPVIEPDGTVALVPEGGGVDALAARLLEAVARAQGDGTWSRLKGCPAVPCGWAFYDESRNRSRTWCSMEVCGNRAKTRRYRSKAEPTAEA